MLRSSLCEFLLTVDLTVDWGRLLSATLAQALTVKWPSGAHRWSPVKADVYSGITALADGHFSGVESITARTVFIFTPRVGKPARFRLEPRQGLQEAFFFFFNFIQNNLFSLTGNRCNMLFGFVAIYTVAIWPLAQQSCRSGELPC